MDEQKVAQGVDALDGVRVGVEGAQEPGVFLGYEGVGSFVGPELFQHVITSFVFNFISWLGRLGLVVG